MKFNGYSISINNWKKESIIWFNNLTYILLAFVAAINAAKEIGYDFNDVISDEKNRYLVLSVIFIKFIEKITVKENK